jgi:hypothetical protein
MMNGAVIGVDIVDSTGYVSVCAPGFLPTGINVFVDGRCAFNGKHSVYVSVEFTDSTRSLHPAELN